MKPSRAVLAIAALAAALSLGAPAGARADNCIGCFDADPVVDLDVSGRVIPGADGWSAAEFVITPGFPLLARVWSIPPTHLYLGFRGADHWGAAYWPPLTCDYDFNLGLLDCMLPAFSSIDGPKDVRIIGKVDAPAEWGWGTFTATVDPRNDLAEYDEWNNVASVDLPLWPERESYELATPDLKTSQYYRFPPQ
jgi:hypothetical protein